ncbi:unnamed protein product [Miscanthus lutarioriparius]|uniref:HAT C-terminal dimerisation domain-containing protein n=1 Tax=Miscanthus lutarioriparius TaxID=422564 RepID=A0A811RBJ8_9POAL|nr:unnamed protein product [Miscanthus lutarioriparius]
MDMWTSCQNKGYMCVTIHWVDDEWRMKKRIIGFFNVKGRHTGAKLSETFTKVMVNWYIEKKLFALTLDNASSNEVAVHDIISDLKDNDNGSLVCDGIFFHVRCACHILNLVARDGLKAILATITKIKSLVLAVKGSPLQWEMLLKCATESGLDTKRGISMDVSTRWNSTYLMLRDALYYKHAFVRFEVSEIVVGMTKCLPHCFEWDKAFTLYQCLKKFYDLTKILSVRLMQHREKKSKRRIGPSNAMRYNNGDVDEDLENFLYYASEPGMVESNELEKYMAEPLEKIIGEFDILAWWKNKREDYPIITQIVRDVMAIQVSTVASESAFSAAGRVVDPSP